MKFLSPLSLVTKAPFMHSEVYNSASIVCPFHGICMNSASIHLDRAYLNDKIIAYFGPKYAVLRGFAHCAHRKNMIRLCWKIGSERSGPFACPSRGNGDKQAMYTQIFVHSKTKAISGERSHGRGRGLFPSISFPLKIFRLLRTQRARRITSCVTLKTCSTQTEPAKRGVTFWNSD